jgi:hypothetical protein
MSGTAVIAISANGNLTAAPVAPAPAPRQTVFFTTADDVQRNRRRAYERWLEDDIEDETVCILAAAVL